MDYPNKVQKYKVLITRYKKFEKNIKDKKIKIGPSVISLCELVTIII